MDEIRQSNSGQTRLPVNHEKECFSAMERGRSLLSELDVAVRNLHNRFPQVSLILEDRYGARVRAIGERSFEDVPEFQWRIAPLVMNGREFGRIRYLGQLGELSTSDITPLALILTELQHWAQMEGQRRGEKVNKLLTEGVTPAVTRLLSLCGLGESASYTLAAMELTSPTDKYLYMDLLREFLLGRIWAYQDSFQFVAYRPGGLLGIIPGSREGEWQTKLTGWIEEWKDYQSRLANEQMNEVRACVASVDDLRELDSGVRQVDTTLKFAARWNLSGLIRPCVSNTLTYMLANLDENRIQELVQRTLGPILVPDHTELLHTLQVYLFLDQNVAETARALYIHRNTLLYRLRHIEELLGLKLRNTRELSTVWSALEGLELLESSKTNLHFGERV